MNLPTSPRHFGNEGHGFCDLLEIECRAGDLMCQVDNGAAGWTFERKVAVHALEKDYMFFHGRFGEVLPESRRLDVRGSPHSDAWGGTILDGPAGKNFLRPVAATGPAVRADKAGKP